MESSSESLHFHEFYKDESLELCIWDTACLPGTWVLTSLCVASTSADPFWMWEGLAGCGDGSDYPKIVFQISEFNTSITKLWTESIAPMISLLVVYNTSLPINVCILILRTCEYIRLQREVKVANEINVAHHCILKIIGRLSWWACCNQVSLKVGESELKGIVNLEKLRIIQSEGFQPAIVNSEYGKDHKAKNCEYPLEARKGKKKEFSV